MKPYRFYLRPLRSRHPHPCRPVEQNFFTLNPLGHPGRGRATLNADVVSFYFRAQRVPYSEKSICYGQNSRVRRRLQDRRNAFGGRTGWHPPPVYFAWAGCVLCRWAAHAIECRCCDFLPPSPDYLKTTVNFANNCYYYITKFTNLPLSVQFLNCGYHLNL
jgi:hypothetical protein